MILSAYQLQCVCLDELIQSSYVIKQSGWVIKPDDGHPWDVHLTRWCSSSGWVIQPDDVLPKLRMSHPQDGFHPWDESSNQKKVILIHLLLTVNEIWCQHNLRGLFRLIHINLLIMSYQCHAFLKSTSCFKQWINVYLIFNFFPSINMTMNCLSLSFWMNIILTILMEKYQWLATSWEVPLKWN